jgi:membrane fusion protein, epimerase transport system
MKSVIYRKAQENRVIIAALLAIGLVLGMGGAWVYKAPLASAAIASGQITVSSNRKAVQHFEGGVVNRVLVKEGEWVKPGQVLIELDPVQKQAQLDTLLGPLWSLQAKQARLKAEQSDQARIVWPAALETNRPDLRVQEAIVAQEQAFHNRKLAQKGELAVIDQQLESLLAKIDGLKAQKPNRERTVESFKLEVDDFRRLQQQGFVSSPKVRELERGFDQAQTQLDSVVSELASTQAQIAETKAKRSQVMRDAKREIAKELSQAQSELAEANARLSGSNDSLQRTQILAPSEGTVLELSVFGAGAVIRPGIKILDIVPKDEALVIEAQFSPQDIDLIKVGQIAEVRFAPLRQFNLPRLDGTLIQFSTDRLMNDKTNQPYFVGRVELSTDGLQALKRAGVNLKPGMPADIFVNLKDSTVLSYLLAPMAQSFGRAMRER